MRASNISPSYSSYLSKRSCFRLMYHSVFLSYDTYTMGCFKPSFLQYEIWGFHDGENLCNGQVKTEPRRMASLGLTFPHTVCTYNLLLVTAGAGNAPFQLAGGLHAWRTGLFIYIYIYIYIYINTHTHTHTHTYTHKLPTQHGWWNGRCVSVTHSKYCRRAYG